MFKELVNKILPLFNGKKRIAEDTATLMMWKTRNGTFSYAVIGPVGDLKVCMDCMEAMAWALSEDTPLAKQAKTLLQDIVIMFDQDNNEETQIEIQENSI